MNKDTNAISIVRQMVADGQVSQEVAEKYFPELKESEDARIRKEITELVMQPTWKTEKECRDWCKWQNRVVKELYNQQTNKED